MPQGSPSFGSAVQTGGAPGEGGRQKPPVQMVATPSVDEHWVPGWIDGCETHWLELV